ncbi:hypothetical protein BOTBODRAFT_63022 [Botryobasidium botryosum FD-172 SS1]|uniref:Uncharacterized protein n=1 Tax=Botryobasidium botryosum (strain FD-172 SS1) TaxID=930990 RepID=A0A067MVX9_BOTB1|nr:hypothetical protein BOTBODRAFT_63022 [Botryobasidium botryosum FD-172 SS1]
MLHPEGYSNGRNAGYSSSSAYPQHSLQPNPSNLPPGQPLSSHAPTQPPNASPYDQPRTINSAPILLPQRRPGDVHRGFVMAYPPVLASVGIDSSAWFEFMEAYNASLKVSPAVHVVRLGVRALGLIPEASVQTISTVGGFAVKHAGRSRAVDTADSFLQRENEMFFRPRGLAAAVIKFTDVADSGMLPPTAELVYQEPQPAGRMEKIDGWMDQRAQDKLESRAQDAMLANGMMDGGQAPPPYQVGMIPASAGYEPQGVGFGQSVPPPGSHGFSSAGHPSIRVVQKSRGTENDRGKGKKLKDYLYLYVTEVPR